MSAPHAAAPAPVQAACGTGWTSQRVPPRTIKVLRTASGAVQTVNFRRYVAIVMASGEWPTRLPQAALEVGATATKQYAWYYALKGSHRSAYRTSSGRCYDVRDDTNDQLFRPGSAHPTAKQRRAIDATWGLTLRKGGRFFRTGYRTGSAARCATDADGWLLYYRSVADCARRKGWSRERIQHAYYAPRLSFVWMPGVFGPAVTTPRVTLTTGSTLASGPATVRWLPVKGSAEITRYELQHRAGRGGWRNVRLAAPKSTSASVRLHVNRTHEFRVRAIKRTGKPGMWSTSAARTALLRGPRGVTLSGSSIDPAEGAARRARITFTGRAIAYVAPTGPGMGKAIIKVNGRQVALVNLERENATTGQLVWKDEWQQSRERVVVVQPVDPTKRVDIDGFLLLR